MDEMRTNENTTTIFGTLKLNTSFLLKKKMLVSEMLSVLCLCVCVEMVFLRVVQLQSI